MPANSCCPTTTEPATAPSPLRAGWGRKVYHAGRQEGEARPASESLLQSCRH